MYRFIGIVVLTVNLIPYGFTDTPINLNAGLEPYDLLFDNAVEAYYKGDWISVILNMERALRNKGTVRRVRAHCRLSCANQTDFGEPVPGVGVPIPGSGSVEDLSFFQKILKRADCVNSCEGEKLGHPSLHKISEAVELEFRKRTPYNYLQVAYFKINKLDKAVAAAHTFYQANPDHLEMRQNLDYYRMMAGVKETDFKDLEARPHMEEFLEGKKLYSADDFAPSVDHFEGAVTEYFSADLECRALCEGAYDYDGYNYLEYSADLFQAMTDHYIQVLNCKQNCVVDLATLPGSDKTVEDFLPSHFNYLQFSYYNTENYEKAIECAKTYLLFHPEDEVMVQNLAFYSATLGEDKAAGITAREVVQQYIKQSLLEKELLYFAYEVFGITFVDPDKWTPADVMPLKLREKQKVERETAARITEEIGNLMKEIETLVEEKNKDSGELSKVVREGGSVLYDDITVTMTSKSLNGSQRVVLDNVITEDECRELHRLSNTAAMMGDGYRGKPSPHSSSEMFQGVTVLKALKLGQEGKVPLKSARLFFELSEKVRKVLESYFRLETPLYFSYTHLVCRSAIDEKQEGREDLSHPVHADNCLLVSELNECIKEPPAYTHRDYSAILYLNDDFEGGNFLFTELDAKTVTAVVRPQCGRVVGFGAGKENPHGVKAVTKGQRCAVALWSPTPTERYLTPPTEHSEKERIQAEDLLKMFSSPLDAEFQRSPSEPKPKPVQSDQPATETAEQPIPEPGKQVEPVQSDQSATETAEQPIPEPGKQAEPVQSDQSATQTAEQPIPETGKQASEQGDKQADQSADKEASQSADKKADQPTDKTDSQSTDTKVDQPTDKKDTQSTDTKADQPTDKKDSQSTGTKVDKPTDKKEQPKDKKEVKKPAPKQAAKPKQKSAEKADGKQKVKQSDKAKAKAAEKKDKPAAKKNADAKKDKPPVKKAAADKSGGGGGGSVAKATDAKQRPKAKSSEPHKDSQERRTEASSAADSEKDKDEL
ncbi:prolyl 3-hydroxylase 1 [Anguilla rostrata]|uniref:prolyl 3-hydroxylase 1 n=1 Tax=Anguilla rostrata TaxID=7938 RepID=UPI0030D227DA